MSFIVKGYYKPQACEQWKNGEFRICWFMDENDNCKIQRGSRGKDRQEQYADCPLVRIKRNHGELIDAEKGDMYLEAETNNWRGW